jgi:hypothetical protein
MGLGHEQMAAEGRSLRRELPGAAILNTQTCPARAGSRDAPLVVGEEASEVARDAAGGPKRNSPGTAQAGGAAPGQDRQLYEQVFGPARGERRCPGDGTFIAQDRASTAVRALSGPSPRSERRE